MPNHLTNQPIMDCQYSPTGKAYQAKNGGCSCSPVTPGLDGGQRDVWLALHNAWFTLIVQSGLLNCGELLHLGEQLITLRDIVFEWDGTTITVHEVPPYSFDLLRTVASRLDGLENVVKNSDGALIELAETLDDLSHRIFTVYP